MRRHRIADELKGQDLIGFVVLKSNETIDDTELEREVVRMVREQVGPVASFKRVVVTERLPNTRSCKILRRAMRSTAEGEAVSVPSTIEDPHAIEELRETMRREGLRRENPAPGR